MIKLHELLEVEENEEFEIKNIKGKYRINNDVIERFTDGNYYKTYKFNLNEINKVKSNIIRKPKFPKEETEYYYITMNGEVARERFYEEGVLDLLKYKLGNFYLTREEAEANKKKWINFYKNPTQIKWEE